MKTTTTGLILAAVALMLVASSTALSQTKRIDVKFKPGTSGSTYTNSVSGYGTVEFVVKASAGQTMSVKLSSANSSLYFNVSKSGSPEALADTARDATEWTGQLPETGEYVVRVYLFRNAARTTKRSVRFNLRLDIS